MQTQSQRHALAPASSNNNYTTPTDINIFICFQSFVKRLRSARNSLDISAHLLRGMSRKCGPIITEFHEWKTMQMAGYCTCGLALNCLCFHLCTLTVMPDGGTIPHYHWRGHVRSAFKRTFSTARVCHW